MFVHVTFEHVRHDYAPVYTIDVAFARNCTKQKVALGRRVFVEWLDSFDLYDL